MRTRLKLGVRPIRCGQLDTFTVSQAAQIGIGHGGNTFVVGEGRHIDPSRTLSSDFVNLPINIAEVILYRNFRLVGYSGGLVEKRKTEAAILETFRHCAPRELMARRFVTPVRTNCVYEVSVHGDRLSAAKDFNLVNIITVASRPGSERRVYFGGRDIRIRRPIVVVVDPSTGRDLDRLVVCDRPGTVRQLAVHGTMIAAAVCFDGDEGSGSHFYLSRDSSSFQPVRLLADEPSGGMSGLSLTAQGLIGQCGDQVRLYLTGGAHIDLASVPDGFHFTGFTPAGSGRSYLTFVSHRQGLSWLYQSLEPTKRRTDTPAYVLS